MPATVARSGRRRTISEINMVPFIDVMLVLLIIFMVTAPLITPSLIDLPSAGRAARTPDRIVQVQIGKDEKITVRSATAQAESRSAAIETIAAVVRDAQAGDAQVPVVISADRSLRYEQVVRVMDALQRAGIARIGLAVQPAP